MIDHDLLLTKIKNKLTDLSPTLIEIEDQTHRHKGHKQAGTGAHLILTVIAPSFSGLSPLQRQRVVFEKLGELLQGPIHALSIRALAPNENQL